MGEEKGEKRRSSEVYCVSTGVIYLFTIGMYPVIYLYLFMYLRINQNEVYRELLHTRLAGWSDCNWFC